MFRLRGFVFTLWLSVVLLATVGVSLIFRALMFSAFRRDRVPAGSIGHRANVAKVVREPSATTRKKPAASSLPKKLPEAACRQTRSVTLSDTAKAAVDRWGSGFRDLAEKAWKSTCGRAGVQTCGGLSRGVTVNVGTDCSGAEAPIWAMRALSISHRHVFSCDVQENVRDFIEATARPSGPIFHDMLRRTSSEVPKHDLYVIGFPCQPYSSLRKHSTRLLREAAAAPYRKMLETLQASKRHPAEPYTIQVPTARAKCQV
jgi:hypothetical protein